jgi:hypothetical protein
LFGLLIESLQEGSVSVDFGYSDNWSETRGSITLHSDGDRGEYALEAGLTVAGLSVDLDLYVNRDVAAARLRQIDNNYYGIVFDTFGDDFRSFANVLGLDRSEVDEVVNAVEMLADLLKSADNASSSTDEYGKLLSDFIQRLNSTTERVNITSGGNNVSAQRNKFVVTARDIADLLEELFDVLENDDNVRAMLESDLGTMWSMGFFYSSYNDFIREMRRETQSFTRGLSGEITASFYTGSSNRLLRIEIVSNLAYEGEVGEFDISIDFGASAHDIWTIEMSAGSGRNRESFVIEWEMRESSRGNETVLRINTDDGWTTGEVTLSWTDRGNFTLSMEDDWSSNTILSGIYTRNSDGFRLEIDDPYRDSFWDESLSLTISASNRAGRIEEVDFINISQWGETLLERVEDFFGYGINIFDPSQDFPNPDHGSPFPPPPNNQDLTGHELLGSWSFSGGMVTYFFWSSEFVYFDDEGFVMADEEFGMWYVDGNYLTVIEDFGQGSIRHYSYEIVNGILYITDSDDDTGEFERIW